MVKEDDQYKYMFSRFAQPARLTSLGKARLATFGERF
jgi:hypothetical protein